MWLPRCSRWLLGGFLQAQVKSTQLKYTQIPSSFNAADNAQGIRETIDTNQTSNEFLCGQRGAEKQTQGDTGTL